MPPFAQAGAPTADQAAAGSRGPTASEASGVLSSKTYLKKKPISAAPTIGATQKSHSWLSAELPTKIAGPVERAGLTDVLVTGMEIR